MSTARVLAAGAALLAAAASACAAYGYSYEFLMGSYLRGPPNDFVNSSALSISGWVKVYSRAAKWSMVAGAAVWNDPRFYNYGLGVNMDAAVWLVGSSFHAANATLTHRIPAGAWTHLAGTFDGAERGGTGRLYVNGALCAFKSMPLQVARLWDGVGGDDLRLSGQLDEVAVWGRVLSGAEVAALHSGPALTGSEPGLLLAYSAESDNATHALDLSPHARHAEIVQQSRARTDAYSPVAVVSYRPDCIDDSCASSSRRPACTPYANESVCGDGAVTGGEQCELGEGCDSECACSAGYEPLGSRCVRVSAATCTVAALEVCSLSLLTCDTCGCVTAATGIGCLTSHGCSGFDAPHVAIGLLADRCTSVCPTPFNCTVDLYPTCMMQTSKGACERKGCYWCGYYCTDAVVDCKPRCGNGVVDAGEACDNIAVTGQTGCAACAAVTPGWTCRPGVCNTTCGDGVVAGDEKCDAGSLPGCLPACKGVAPGYTCTLASNSSASLCACTGRECEGRAGLSGGAIVGIVIAALVVPAALSITLLVLVLRRRPLKREEVGLSALLSSGRPLQVFDYAKSTFIPVDEFHFEVEPETLLFGNELLPINAPVETTLVLTSHHIGGFWQLFADPSDTHVIAFSPDKGCLSKKSSVTIRGTVTLLCTTRVDVNIGLVLDPKDITLETPAIGEGGFGTVYKGTYRSQDVAVKVTKFQDLKERFEDFKREVAALEELRNTYIIGVRFIGAVMIPGKLCLVTEFAPLGSLKGAMKNNNLSLPYKLRAAFDCARGMSYLHQSRILHRDLKPDNLLVFSFSIDAPVVCKLTDFGTTRTVSENVSRSFTKGIGTPVYMAPEILSEEETAVYTLPADVFSFAILLHELYTEMEPYSKMGFKHAWGDTALVFGKAECTDSDCPPELALLIKSCWEHDPEKRPTFQRVAVALAEMLEGKCNVPGMLADSSLRSNVSWTAPVTFAEKAQAEADREKDRHTTQNVAGNSS
eukprot:m51a1_g6837 putative tyrosine protein (986) ;mRNA; f:59376-63467